MKYYILIVLTIISTYFTITHDLDNIGSYQVYESDTKQRFGTEAGSEDLYLFYLEGQIILSKQPKLIRVRTPWFKKISYYEAPINLKTEDVSRYVCLFYFNKIN